MGDKLSNILDSSVAAIVGIVMVASAVIPIAVSQITSLKLLEEDTTMYQTLLGVVIIMVIVGLIIGVIRFFTKSD